MNTILLPDSLAALAPWLALAVKGGLLVAAAGVLTLCLRRARAATRHFVWLTALCGVLLLPLLSHLPGSPAAHWVSWSVDQGAGWWNRIVLTRDVAAAEAFPSAVPEPQVARAPGAGIDTPRSTGGVHSQEPWSATKLLIAIWAAGLLVLAFREWRRRRALRILRTDATPLAGERWDELADDAQRLTGLRRRPPLLVAQSELMPMTWGWIRPVVVLPGSAERWSPERAQLVLRHEFAHIARRDCCTQSIATLACALHWFNPLVWLAANRMRKERELACDDLVLSDGTRPSTYAGHLLEIAMQFTQTFQAAVPIARKTGLERRLRSVLDETRPRGPMRALTAVGVITVGCGLLVLLGGNRGVIAGGPSDEQDSDGLRQAREFFADRERAARKLVHDQEAQVPPMVWKAFQAGIGGEWTALTKLYPTVNELTWEDPEQGETTRLAAQPLKEAYGAYDVWSHVSKHCADAFTRDILNSIPAGSVYFGGTDAGRFLITAAVAGAEPADRFVVLTQNALADGAYLEYLRALHARDLSVPTDQDLQRSFDEYMVDVASRYHAGKLLPGEHMKDKGDGRLEVSGQGAVMQINALLAKRIFEANPDRQFFIEESWPLEWMYPHLSPHGLILKINREPVEELTADVVDNDEEWWAPRVKRMIGGWLRPETPVSEVADFVDRVYHRHDLSGFDGDRGYVTLSDQHDLYGKPRTAIASLYQWRMEQAKTAAEKDRMAAAADLAYRQAFALAPASVEAVARYVKFLRDREGGAVAQRVVKSVLSLASDQGQLDEAVEKLDAAMK